MDCNFWWFLLPQDIIREFTQEDGTKVTDFEGFNLLVEDITWWKLPQKLQLMANFVEYDHEFVWARLPEQVEDFCNFISGLIGNSLTAFNASTSTGDACSTPDLSPYNQTFYHDGAGAYPALGDIVFTDSEGTILLASVLQSAAYQMGNLEYLYTNELGVRITEGCK